MNILNLIVASVLYVCGVGLTGCGLVLIMTTLMDMSEVSYASIVTGLVSVGLGIMSWFNGSLITLKVLSDIQSPPKDQ